MTFDCFTFFNELDLLEIRLHTLDKVVDRFVLVEANITFQGNPKPFYFEDNKERFSRFLNRIIHVKITDQPSFFVNWRRPTSWDIEKYHRNQIAVGLKNCLPSDTIIISDIDEIPNPEKILEVSRYSAIKILEHKNFSYYLNCRNCDASEFYQSGTVIVSYKDFTSAQRLRNLSVKFRGDKRKLIDDNFFLLTKSLYKKEFRKKLMLVEQAGWHFSFLGGVDRIIEKLESFAHIEFNKEEFKNKEAVLDAINSGRDLFGRGLIYEYIAIDDSYPDYIVSNQERFSHLIKR